MITQEQIPKVLGHPVYDKEGVKIGDAKHVFVDDSTGDPDWVTVRTGLFGMTETFVPIRDASMVQDHLEVPFPKSTVKDAPEAAVDAGGHLSAREERKLYRHYGMAWDEPSRAAGGQAGGTDTTGTAGTAAAGAAAGAAGAQGRRDTRQRAAASGTADTTAAHGTRDTKGGAGAAGTAGGAGTTPGTGGYAAGRTGPGAGTDRARGGTGAAAGAAGQRERAHAGDFAMTRSEEELRIGVEQRETGTARLHKYVVTEQVEKSVPVHHEEARIVREPITDENRAQAPRGTEITEAEYEITLHEERPVVETEVVPKERVRLTTEEYVEEQTVRGEVRKERIETDLPEEGGRRPGHGDPGRGRGTRR